MVRDSNNAAPLIGWYENPVDPVGRDGDFGQSRRKHRAAEALRRNPLAPCPRVGHVLGLVGLPIRKHSHFGEGGQYVDIPPRILDDVALGAVNIDALRLSPLEIFPLHRNPPHFPLHRNPPPDPLPLPPSLRLGWASETLFLGSSVAGVCEGMMKIV